MAAVGNEEREITMSRLEGKTVLITGAGQGIGRAIALRFAREKATLVLADMNLAAVEDVAAQVETGGGKGALAVAANITDRTSVEAAFEAAAKAFGQVDVLVNNAGIFENAAFDEMTLSQWQRMLDVNVTGAFHVSQCFLRRALSLRHGGAIVNMSSVSGQIAFTGSSHYNVSKGAISALTRSLAVEFGQYGIRTNAIAPGIIQTDMTRPALSDPVLAGEWLQRIPVRSYGSVEQVADVALFLASEEAAYINGEIITMDGGAIPNWSKPDDQTRAIRRDWYPA